MAKGIQTEQLDRKVQNTLHKSLKCRETNTYYYNEDNIYLLKDGKMIIFQSMNNGISSNDADDVIYSKAINVNKGDFITDGEIALKIIEIIGNSGGNTEEQINDVEDLWELSTIEPVEGGLYRIKNYSYAVENIYSYSTNRSPIPIYMSNVIFQTHDFNTNESHLTLLCNYTNSDGGKPFLATDCVYYNNTNIGNCQKLNLLDCLSKIFKPNEQNYSSSNLAKFFSKYTYSISPILGNINHVSGKKNRMYITNVGRYFPEITKLSSKATVNLEIWDKDHQTKKDEITIVLNALPWSSDAPSKEIKGFPYSLSYGSIYWKPKAILKYQNSGWQAYDVEYCTTLLVPSYEYFKESSLISAIIKLLKNTDETKIDTLKQNVRQQFKAANQTLFTKPQSNITKMPYIAYGRNPNKELVTQVNDLKVQYSETADVCQQLQLTNNMDIVIYTDTTSTPKKGIQIGKDNNNNFIIYSHNEIATSHIAIDNIDLLLEGEYSFGQFPLVVDILKLNNGETATSLIKYNSAMSMGNGIYRYTFVNIFKHLCKLNYFLIGKYAGALPFLGDTQITHFDILSDYWLSSGYSAFYQRTYQWLFMGIKKYGIAKNDKHKWNFGENTYIVLSKNLTGIKSIVLYTTKSFQDKYIEVLIKPNVSTDSTNLDIANSINQMTNESFDIIEITSSQTYNFGKNCYGKTIMNYVYSGDIILKSKYTNLSTYSNGNYKIVRGMLLTQDDVSTKQIKYISDSSGDKSNAISDIMATNYSIPMVANYGKLALGQCKNQTHHYYLELTKEQIQFKSISRTTANVESKSLKLIVYYKHPNQNSIVRILDKRIYYNGSIMNCTNIMDLKDYTTQESFIISGDKITIKDVDGNTHPLDSNKKYLFIEYGFPINIYEGSSIIAYIDYYQENNNDIECNCSTNFGALNPYLEPELN